MPIPPLRRRSYGRRPRALVVGALVTAAGLMLAGCAGRSPAAAVVAVPPADGVELVIAVHAGAPAPQVPGVVRAEVASAIRDERPVGVLTVEGKPREIQPPLPMSITGTTPDQRAAADRRNLATVTALVASARPETAGADLLASLLQAASEAHAANGGVRRLIVLDNGMSDRGAIDFTVAGMTDAAPADVVTALLHRRTITPTTFAGLTVEFVGLGTTVAPPQKALPAAQVTAIGDIYSAVVRAGGGTPVLTPLVRTGPAIRTDLPVAAVGASDTKVTLGGTSKLGDGSSVGFEPGTATFRDPAAARRLLGPLAAWLAPGSAHHAVVVGTTSSDGTASRASDIALSLARADAVRDLLVALGADRSKIGTEGKGYTADPPDRVNGVLDPAKAAQNRVVRITTYV